MLERVGKKNLLHVTEKLHGQICSHVSKHKITALFLIVIKAPTLETRSKIAK